METKIEGKLQKIKAAAIILVGLALTGNGIYDYFNLRDSTYVKIPRILSGIYNTAGAEVTFGLEVLLGLGIAFFGWRLFRIASMKLKKNEDSNF